MSAAKTKWRVYGVDKRDIDGQVCFLGTIDAHSMEDARVTFTRYFGRYCHVTSVTA